MLHLTNRSVDNVLNIVKTIKLETSIDLTCEIYNILKISGRLSQVKVVEQKLQIESSEQIIEALTNDELKTAAELFVYLNMCPGTIKPWIKFYKDLFQTQSPNQIILTLNRLIKGTRTPQNEYFHNLGEKFLNRVKSLFPGKPNYTESNGEALLYVHSLFPTSLFS